MDKPYTPLLGQWRYAQGRSVPPWNDLLAVLAQHDRVTCALAPWDGDRTRLYLEILKIDPAGLQAEMDAEADYDAYQSAQKPLSWQLVASILKRHGHTQITWQNWAWSNDGRGFSVRQRDPYVVYVESVWKTPRETDGRDIALEKLAVYRRILTDAGFVVAPSGIGMYDLLVSYAEVPAVVAVPA